VLSHSGSVGRESQKSGLYIQVIRNVHPGSMMELWFFANRNGVCFQISCGDPEYM
jgi:hypothetical protein